MKKFLVLTVGLGLMLGTVSFAQDKMDDTKKMDSTKKKKKSKKEKKTDTTATDKKM